MEATRKDEERYSCQPRSSCARPPAGSPWDVRQYVLDVTSGNVGVLAMIRGVIVGVFNEYQEFSRRFLPRWPRIHGGRRFPFIDGSLQKTPSKPWTSSPAISCGSRARKEIVATLDTENRSRGMSFDAEMLKYCGRQGRVLRRVKRDHPRADRQDDGPEEPLHHPRGHDLHQRLPPALPEGHLPLLEGDLARTGVAPRLPLLDRTSVVDTLGEFPPPDAGSDQGSGRRTPSRSGGHHQRRAPSAPHHRAPS
jgi:hypothetical protein